jgi:ribosomal protein S18 acetylase RimI-like enzyme
MGLSLIRRASFHDLPGVYRVCLATGDSGRDATGLYRNPDLLGHLYVGPYVVGQPDLALVVADAEGVAGYCLAAADTRAFEAWTEERWWPILREQYPLTDGDSRDDEAIRLFHAPPRTRDTLVAEHPAHLHVDLLARVRGQGLGRRLVERCLATLRERGLPGVHLDVAADNPNAIAFYEHLGFVELERGPDRLYMGMRLDQRRLVERISSPGRASGS